VSLQGPTSYQVPGRAPKPKRPGAVTAASILLYVAAGLIAGIGALATVEALRTDSELPTTLPADFKVTSGMVAGVATAVAVIYALIAAGIVTLGILVRAGRNPARIVAWVVTGLIGVCCGCTGVLGAIGRAAPTNLPADSDPVGAALAVPQPTWYTAGNAIASIALVLVCLVVIVLLAIPVANDYFRKEQETWVPPAWPGSYPGGGYGAPAYPQPPAIPQYPYPPQRPAQPQPPAPPPPPAGPQPAAGLQPQPQPSTQPPDPATPADPPRPATTPWEPPDSAGQ
jgi:hypothetical protein